MIYSKFTLLFTFALVGCGNLNELRDRPADRTILVNGKYDSIAKCVAGEADKISEYVGLPTLRFNEVERTANLFRLHPDMSPVYDIKFIQLNLQTVRVEGRRIAFLERLWPAIEKCSTPK